MVHSLLKRVPVPTGFLVARANVALAVTSELIRRGVAVPQKASVISRDSDHFLDYFSPRIARYTRDPELHARTVAKLLLQVAEDGVVPEKKVRLIPGFVEGASLGALK
jgi:DNA-binding LacI/PurR family transcriptional regulator